MGRLSAALVTGAALGSRIDLNLRHWFRGTAVAIIGPRRGYAAARSLPAAGVQTLFVGRVSQRLADENR